MPVAWKSWRMCKLKLRHLIARGDSRRDGAPTTSQLHLTLNANAFTILEDIQEHIVTAPFVGYNRAGELHVMVLL